MKKKKEEEHYEIPPSSKNAKEINIQMATINPFFQESSHLPKNLQQHLSTLDNHNKNNKKKDRINRKRRGTRISLAIGLLCMLQCKLWNIQRVRRSILQERQSICMFWGEPPCT